MNAVPSMRRQLRNITLVTATILLLPLMAMQFTREVNWSVSDFVIAGVLLFGTGLTYVMISRASKSPVYRLGVAVAVMTGLALIWINLAVGIIGSEDNPANALYVGVIVVGLIGIASARLRPQGMARAAFVTAAAQALVPFVALIIWRPSFDNTPGIVGVFILNAMFAGAFVVAGMLFKRAAEADKR